MIIGISGTHGTGKTTFLYKLAHDMKIRHGSSSIKIISEISRECPFPYFKGQAVSSEEAQLWIFASQLLAELDSKKYDITITDRTIYDVIAYTMEVNDDLAAEMLGLARFFWYDRIYFVRPYKTSYAFDDGGRSTNNDLRVKVDKNLQKLLTSSDIEIREMSIKRMN